MEITAAIALGLKILEGVQKAIQAGRTEVSEEDLDAAFEVIDASDDRLSAAIARARERQGG